MKKQVYQQPRIRIIPMLPSEVMAFSYDTGDFLSRKKELDTADWQEEDETPNRFGYWD